MKKKMTTALVIIAVVGVVAAAVLAHPAWGNTPSGERLERIKQSPNWNGKAFVNRQRTMQMTSDENLFTAMWNYLFRKPANTTPSVPIKAVKTDLSALDLSQDQMIWFGHSSYLLVLDGKKILVDPVLTSEFPSSWMMKPFEGADLYTPSDIPAVDYLIITHDHWDHLDYPTVKAIRERVGHVICPLGVGAHLEKWGYRDNVTEMDWDETYKADGITFTCLTARHFSGRMLKRNQSLWASFMIEAGKTVYVGGDSGYGSHFAKIGERFENIDLAIVEDGQYNKAWAQIHTLPEQHAQVLRDLGAKGAVPVHNSKFSLAPHAWDEPVKTFKELAQSDTSLHVNIPTIGEPIVLGN